MAKVTKMTKNRDFRENPQKTFGMGLNGHNVNIIGSLVLSEPETLEIRKIPKRVFLPSKLGYLSPQIRQF